MTIESTAFDAVPVERESAAPLGRHLDGCRIGFDLGASDRKCAAVIDGQVVFSDEVPWNPSAQSDPQYHFDGINDSLRRAAMQVAARRRHRRQRGRRLREQRSARRFALSRSAAGPVRHPRAAAVLRPARGVGRHSLRRGERWRGDGPGRVHGPERWRRAGRRHGQQSGRRIRHTARRHHQLAERTGLRAGGLPRRMRPPTNGRATPAWARNTSRSRPWAGCLRPPGSNSRPTCRCR